MLKENLDKRIFLKNKLGIKAGIDYNLADLHNRLANNKTSSTEIFKIVYIKNTTHESSKKDDSKDEKIKITSTIDGILYWQKYYTLKWQIDYLD